MVLTRLYVCERLKGFKNSEMSTYGKSFPFFPPKPLVILLGPVLSQEADMHGLHQGALWLPVGLQTIGSGRGNIRRLKGDENIYFPGYSNVP